jgi:hypothetical protein
MNQLSHIEIVFTPHAKGYKATTPTFPKCKGIGKTREEATLKLGKSISQSFSSTVFEGLNDIFSSQEFTDVLDPNGPKGQEKRLFPLFSSHKGRRINLELASIAELAKIPDKKTDKDISSLKDMIALSGITQLVEEFTSEEFSAFDKYDKIELPPIPEKPGSIIFGFPLNLN